MRLGIIGSGNMGSAIMKGVISNNLITNKDISIYDIDTLKTTKLKEEFGVNVSPNYEDILLKSDIILLAVKPNVCDKVLENIKKHLTKSHIVISIMAGITIKRIEDILGDDIKIVRVMPNTPAAILEAMSVYSINKNIISKDIELIESLLNSFGKSIMLKEDLMDITTGVSGSSPAYVFLMIEAMADAAVKGGIPRDVAYTLVAQTIMGSAKMVLETNKHPGVLKDMVTSPGGTTIEAIESLEKNNFRFSLMDAVNRATLKSKELGKKDK